MTGASHKAYVFMLQYEVLQNSLSLFRFFTLKPLPVLIVTQLLSVTFEKGSIGPAIVINLSFLVFLNLIPYFLGFCYLVKFRIHSSYISLVNKHLTTLTQYRGFITR